MSLGALARHTDRQVCAHAPVGRENAPVTRATCDQEREGQLVQRCRNRDVEAQAELWHCYQACILYTIRERLTRHGVPPDVDEDVAAIFWFDLFYRKPWRLRAYCSGRGRLKAYLRSIARLTVLDFLEQERRQRMVTLPLADLHWVADQVQEIEVQENLEHLLGHLSKGDRALLLSYLHCHHSFQDTWSDSPEAARAATCLRQRKKRLICKIHCLLGLQQKRGESGRK